MVRRLTALLFAASALVVASVGGFLVVKQSLAPSNPFQERSVDRSQPALLQSLTDLAELHAAEGRYNVLVDVERDVRYVPALVKGERVVYAANGTVAAYVDLSGLGPDAVVVDGATVRVTLPAVRLGAPALDLEQSRVVARQRGVLDRIGSATGSDLDPTGHVLATAQAKLGAAAAGDAELRRRAEANARATVTALVRSLGFERVDVVFAPPPPA